MTSSRSMIAGRYRVQESLGQGGMGRVWLGRDEKLNRTVALKEIRLTTDDVEELRDRALREARTAARLDHPAVVRVYDIVIEDGEPWIVMQYVPSRSLNELVAQEGPLSPQRAAGIGLGVLGALAAAHRAGILHRDVKPGNVLITDDGTAVLTDFGLATIAGDPAITRSGLLIGSPSFMAPERAEDGPAGPEGDLWSLGATLYFAVEGHPPYDRPTVIGTLAALANEDPPPPVHAGPLRPVVEALMRRNPAARLRAGEVERQLRAAASGSPTPTRLMPTIAGRAPVPRQRPGLVTGQRTGPGTALHPMPPVERRTGRVVAALAVLAVLAAAVIWALTRDTNQEQVPPSTQPSSAAEPPPAAPTSQASTSQPSPTETRDDQGLPNGWQLYQDPTGFAVGVPKSWKVSREGSIVYFREPDGGRVLGIDQTDTPKPDPVVDWLTQEAFRVARGDFPGYRRVRLEAVDYFDSAADWEFTYDSGGTRVHVVNRGFITAPTKAYGMWWSTPDSRWNESLNDLAVIQRTFRPAG